MECPHIHIENVDDVEVMCMQCGSYVEVTRIHIVKFPRPNLHIGRILETVLFITDQHKASQNHAVTITSDVKCTFYLDLE